MAQLTDDCFAFGDGLMSLDDARRTLAARVDPVAAVEDLALNRSLGRVLAADLVSTTNVPPHDNAAVDGYSVYFDDLSETGETILPVGGLAAAGHPLPRPQRRGEAIRIYTGAPMPTGEDGSAPDTVMMQEDVRLDGQRVALPTGLKRGANRRFAGEDVCSGDLVLSAGRRLRPQDVGMAAAIGLASVPVRMPLRVAILSTGDEVSEPGSIRRPGTIYDSNRFTLNALVKGLGAEVQDMGILPDDRTAIEDALAKAAARVDLVITSGGVSAGGEDHVKDAVAALGAIDAWRLAIKPGRPVALGVVRGVPFIGLPGNPVAVMVTFLALARPLVQRLSGETVSEPRRYPARSDFQYRKKAGRREFVRVSLASADDGSLLEVPRAVKFPRDGAGVLSSMVGSDGLVELAESVERVDIGDIVPFIPFNEVGL